MSSLISSPTMRFPIATVLPGLAGRKITLTYGNAGIISGEIEDRLGATYQINHVWQGAVDLFISVSDGSICQFLRNCSPLGPPRRDGGMNERLDTVTAGTIHPHRESRSPSCSLLG